MIIVKLDKNFKKIFLSVLFIIGYYVVKIIYIDILLYSKWIILEIGFLVLIVI